MDKREIDFKFVYPNLIIFLGPNKNESLFRQLQKSFNEFKYGPIFKQEGTCYNHELRRQVSTCRIMQGSGKPICLADGEGTLPCDAEQQAVESLLNKLCDTCYVIQANPEYFTKEKVPSFALNADPLQSHIYKVVFLKKNSHGVPFPKPVCGAIDYVENYYELMEYIETHTKSDTKADLFILNVLKRDRARISEICQTNGLQVQFLVRCSGMGVYAYRQMSTFLILQSLLKNGGKTVKYKLIGPRDKIHQQMEERTTHQDWNNQGTYHEAQANIQPISRGRESYCPPSVSDTTSAYTSDYQSPLVDHGSASQPCVQRAEAPGQDNNGTPNWVMKFIQSAPKKPGKPLTYKRRCRTKRLRQRGNMYFRIHQHMEERTTHQDWNNQGTYYEAQANIQPISRGQEAYCPLSVSDAQANTSDYHTPLVDHGSASQTCVQGAEAPGQDNDGTPNWAMKIMESAPKKPQNPPVCTMIGPAESPRNRDDVYFRYKFIPPKPNPYPVSTSSLNIQGADRRPNKNFENDNVNTCKDKDCEPTLSERLQRRLAEQNLSNRQDLTNRQNKQVP